MIFVMIRAFRRFPLWTSTNDITQALTGLLRLYRQAAQSPSPGTTNYSEVVSGTDSTGIYPIPHRALAGKICTIREENPPHHCPHPDSFIRSALQDDGLAINLKRL